MMNLSKFTSNKNILNGVVVLRLNLCPNKNNPKFKKPNVSFSREENNVKIVRTAHLNQDQRKC